MPNIQLSKSCKDEVKKKHAPETALVFSGTLVDLRMLEKLEILQQV
jgi:hypothetical protein